MADRYVRHDGFTWRVQNETGDEDGHWLQLSRRVPGRIPIILWAKVTECESVTRERKRRFRDDSGVIEFDGRGNITLREKGRRQRYTTTIKGLIFLCAQSQATIKKRERDFKRRTKK